MSNSVTRLYKTFHPEEYDLALNLNKPEMTFAGSVTITGKKVGRPSKRLTFHQKDLTITAATITQHTKSGDELIQVTRINRQKTYDEVRLHSEGLLYPGNYSVHLEFSGLITKPMNGIYPCEFMEDGIEKILLATQFESHHAREAFPCIDEPEAKAVFRLQLLTPLQETVITNTPILTQESTTTGLVTRFEPTPKMSTYLLAFACGELDYTESKTKDGVLVRAYSTPEKVAQTAHSLDVAVRALEFFGDYFGTPYPLPKLDMLALPDFSSGAMENWGLVTYREVAMLIDGANSSIENRQYVATVVTHELSHQWFGNLVTMKWWDDLWLNESFANLMEYRAVDALFPDWDIWEQFISGEGVSAKRRDSLIDVQAVHCVVNHPDEISTLFDPSIVYAKGGTILYMLMHYVGEEVFRAGLQQYFTSHSYSNTTADDLWNAIGTASGKDILAFMSDWINKPGYPVVSIDYSAANSTLSLSQSRFLSEPGSHDPNAPFWHVPLAATWKIEDPLLISETGERSVTPEATPLLLNHSGASYFLPRYKNPSHRESVVNAIAAGQVEPLDRLLTIDNLNLLQRGGLSEATELLDLFPSYTGESNENVWGSLSVAASEIRRLTEGVDEADTALDELLQGLVMPSFNGIGWDDAAADTSQTLRLRSLLLSMAAGAKTTDIIDEGLRRFQAMKELNDLAASIRPIVLYIGARFGSQLDFERLLKLHDTSSSADEKEELAAAVCTVKDEARYQVLIDRLTGSTIRRQDLMHWYVWLLRNRYARSSTWEWMTAHWDWIQKEFESDKSYGMFARYAGSIFSKSSELVLFRDFFDPKQSVVALKRTILLAKQEIASRVTWREMNQAAVLNWLAKKPSPKSS